MLGLSSSLVKGGASLLTFVKDNLKLYLDFKSNKSDTLKFPSEGSTSFDGSDDYIALNSDISLTGEFTFNFWLSTTTSGTSYLVSKSSPENWIRFDIASSNARLAIDGTSSSYITSLSIPSDGSWFHFSITRDSSNVITAYVDGVQDGNTITQSGTFTINEIGRFLSVEFAGKMANMAIWSRVLEPEEIQSIMNKSYSQLKGVEKTSLVSWWGLDSQSNGVVQPATGETLGTNLFTDSTFDLSGTQSASTTGTHWTTGSAWTIANGEAIYDATAHENRLELPSATFQNAGLYKFSFTVSDANTKAGIKIKAGGNDIIPTAYYDNGSHVIYYNQASAYGSAKTLKIEGRNDVHGAFKLQSASWELVTSNTGFVTGATTTTSVYGGNAPILPRAVDVAKEGQADAIGDGSALFNGTSDYVSVATSAHQTTKGTISGWFYPVLNGNQTLFSVGTASAGKVRALFLNGANLKFIGYSADWDTTVDIVTNTWYHLGLTWDGNNVVVYVNGIAYPNSSLTLNTPDGTELKIGTATWTNNFYFDGNISQLGLWQGALTQAQIQSVMESTSYSKIPADVKSTLGNNVVSYNSVDNVNNTFVNNIATYTANGYIFFSGVAPVSTLFKLEYTVLTRTAIGLRLAGGSSAFGVVALDSSVGTHSYNLVSSSNSNANYLSFNSTGFRGTITDISVKPISNEIVAYYPLDGSSSANGVTQDVTTGETLGAERVLNSDFSDGENLWTLNNANVVNGVLEIDEGAFSYYAQQSVDGGGSNYRQFESGYLMKLEIVVDEYTSGGTIIYATGNNIGTFSSAGTHTIYYKPSANEYIRLRSDGGGFEGKISSVSIKRVTSNTGVLK